MTVLRVARAGGLAGALAALAVAGATLGGWWWPAALLGALGAASGRTGSLVHAVATSALAGAAASAGATWLIPLLVVGIVATVETVALGQHANRVRTSVPVGPALAAALAAGACAAAVLALATLAPPFAVPLALGAVLAVTALVTALRA